MLPFVVQSHPGADDSPRAGASGATPIIALVGGVTAAVGLGAVAATGAIAGLPHNLLGTALGMGGGFLIGAAAGAGIGALTDLLAGRGSGQD
jgi:hypothetical protein